MKALPNHYRLSRTTYAVTGTVLLGDGQYSIEFFVDDLFGLLDHLVIEENDPLRTLDGRLHSPPRVRKISGEDTGARSLRHKERSRHERAKVKRSGTVRSIRRRRR